MTSPARFIAAFAALVCAAACAGSEAAKADTQQPAKRAASADSLVPHFSAAQFAQLHWVEGNWRGLTSSGKSFFESYRMVNDSTMEWRQFADSSFKTPTSRATIALRAGLVLNQSNGAPWVATRLDSNVVNFASTKGPANHFAWVRLSADKWEAQVFTTDSTGHQQRVVYSVQRLTR